MIATAVGFASFVVGFVAGTMLTRRIGGRLTREIMTIVYLQKGMNIEAAMKHAAHDWTRAGSAYADRPDYYRRMRLDAWSHDA